MTLLRFLAPVLATLALAAPAAANPDRPLIPGDLDGSVTTANVVVHFRTAGDDAVTNDAAMAVADATEQALAKFLALGFPRPKDDGDGHIDVYYFKYGEANQHGLANGDTAGQTTSGYIRLNTAYDLPLQTVKHELFHLVQLAIGRGREGWLSESTASWARWQVDNPPAENFQYLLGGDYRYPLNCEEDSGGLCEGFGGGYTSWLFFSEFDAQFVHELLIRVADLYKADKKPHGLDALQAELAERNLTLQGVLTSLGTKMVQGTLPYPESRTLLPKVDTTLVPPRSGTASELESVTVHHASPGFLSIAPEAGACTPVPLALDVQAPATVAVSFVQRGGAVTPLTAGANTVAWIACAANPAMIVVANGTTDADAQVVSATGRVVTPALTGLKVAAKTTRRARRSFTVPVKVQSSAAGSLKATLAGGPAKTVALKAGANAFKLKVPKSFRAKKAKLTLTPSLGIYRGTAITKKLRFKTRR